MRSASGNSVCGVRAVRGQCDSFLLKNDVSCAPRALLCKHTSLFNRISCAFLHFFFSARCSTLRCTGYKIPAIENLGATQVCARALVSLNISGGAAYSHFHFLSPLPAVCASPTAPRLQSPQDQFDHFDFSDNEIQKLDNFPLLKRLSSVALNNNKISVIGDGLGAQLPRLDTLLLTNNRFSQLSELEPLAGSARVCCQKYLFTGRRIRVHVQPVKLSVGVLSSPLPPHPTHRLPQSGAPQSSRQSRHTTRRLPPVCDCTAAKTQAARL